MSGAPSPNVMRTNAESEQVAGWGEVDFHAWHRRDAAVEAHGLEAGERFEGVCLGEELLGWRPPRVAVLVGLSGVFFLQPAGVGQHELAQVRRAWRAEHVALEALPHQARQ